MAKVLVVRKPDRTIHVIPLSNKATLQAYNNRLPVTHKMKLEEMEEEEAKKLPFIDKNYVSPMQAQDKLKKVESELNEKASQIAELEAKIAALTAQSKPADKPLKAEELIEAIGKADTVEDAKKYLENETRVTVVAAVNKRIAELEAK